VIREAGEPKGRLVRGLHVRHGQWYFHGGFATIGYFSRTGEVLSRVDQSNPGRTCPEASRRLGITFPFSIARNGCSQEVLARYKPLQFSPVFRGPLLPLTELSTKGLTPGKKQICSGVAGVATVAVYFDDL
jgi:hypothetical protein